jgi:hypothetical protein
MNLTTGVCWECGGPCLTYKGSEHGMRCRACLRVYLDAGAAAAAARQTQERAELRAHLNAAAKRGNHGTGGNDRRQPGDGLAVGHIVRLSASRRSTKGKSR